MPRNAELSDEEPWGARTLPSDELHFRSTRAKACVLVALSLVACVAGAAVSLDTAQQALLSFRDIHERTTPYMANNFSAPSASDSAVELIRREKQTRGDDARATPSLHELSEGKNISSALCDIHVPEKVVSGRYYYRVPPAVPGRNDGSPLIPRKIHQSWFERINSTSYPNLVKATSSWEIYHRGGGGGGSGAPAVGLQWEYNFYSDADAAAFISENFPPEVLEAFRAVRMGAFKADLFRYCVLFVEGGIYADVDVLLMVNLTIDLPPDVGFWVPVDSGYQGGLWQGLIASAPGHPFLAKAIELAVNNIRNRFTIIDIAGLFCRNKQLANSKPLFFHSDLYLTGPGFFGMAVNDALGLPRANPFRAGYMQPCENRTEIPGRCFLLAIIKDGQDRLFTFGPNISVARPGFVRPDRKSPNPRYGMPPGSVWGRTQVYTDLIPADEEIRIIVSDGDD